MPPGRADPPEPLRVPGPAGPGSGQELGGSRSRRRARRSTSANTTLCLRCAGRPEHRAVARRSNELRYLPLGVGVIIPPWNFPLAILAGMTMAALVSGNTVVVKPSSDTPAWRRSLSKCCEEAGFPPGVVNLVAGSRRRDWRPAGGASEDAFHLLHRFARSRPANQRTGREAAQGPNLDQARRGGDGRQGRHHRRRDADLGSAVAGVALSAFGYQGQKCSACSRAIVDEKMYDESAWLKARVAKISHRWGPRRIRANYMGPVINQGHEDDPKATSRSGPRRQADRRRQACPGTATSLNRRSSPASKRARIFQEEIFGPVLARDQGARF